VRETLECELDLSYGSSDREKYDVIAGNVTPTGRQIDHQLLSTPVSKIQIFMKFSHGENYNESFIRNFDEILAKSIRPRF